MNQKTIVLKKQKTSIDWILAGLTFLLVAIGLVAIYDASVISAFRDFGDRFYYIKNQIAWAALGFVALALFSFFDYHKILKIAHFIFIATFILLILVLIPSVGTQVLGARRWISIASFTFQPSEVAKLATVFYGASIMGKFEKYKIKLFDSLLAYFLPIFTLAALVVFQPDLGTALIFIFLALVIYFIGNAPIWHFLTAIPILVFGIIFAILKEPYRIGRIRAFIDPFYDPQGASYQINQLIIAISSGGLLGVGLGGSRSKFEFIPEVHNDAIFAVIVEELGFIGGLILISLFLFLILRALDVAKGAPDYSGKLLASGMSALLAVQILFNLASNVALVPLTGVPLPFISYGGSSLFVTLTSIGILLNIRKQSTNTFLRSTPPKRDTNLRK